MAGTSGFEPEHAGVKVLCLTGLATSQYIIYGGQSRIWTCKSFPTNGFQDRFLTSLDIRHIFGASHGTRTRTRKSELPPQDSVSTKFHQERIFYFEIGSRWTQTIVSLTVIEVVSPQCCFTTCFQCPLRDSNPALQAWKARVLNHLDQKAILVGVTGVEPAWIFIQRLLRPLCIPVSAHAESYNNFYIIYNTPIECWCQAFLKNYLKMNYYIWAFKTSFYRRGTLLDCYRKRPLVSWITRSKRP